MIRNIIIVSLFLIQIGNSNAESSKSVEILNEGFRLQSVKKGSVYDQIGLKKGDILTKYSISKTISTPQIAMSMYQELKKGNITAIEIKRDGKAITVKPTPAAKKK